MFIRLMSILLLSVVVSVSAATLTVIVGDQTFNLEREDLFAVKPTSLVTQTPWDTEPSSFDGIYLADLLEHLQIKTDFILATALNNYEVTIPIVEAIEQGAFLAMYRDGRPMPVRARGPFWIIFPWDSLELEPMQARMANSWAIWQLRSIEAVAQP